MRHSYWYVLAISILFLTFSARAQVFVDEIILDGDPTLQGLAWVNDTLYATSSFPEDALFRIDLATETAETVFALDFDPRGVAWDGQNWRISTGFDSSDPEMYTISPDGVVLDTLAAPSPLTLGLTLHDGLLFATRAYPDEEAAIAGLDPNDGTELETIAFPSTQPGGIAFIEPDVFWTTNVGDDSGSDIEILYKIDRTTGEILQELDLPDEEDGRPRGLAYDGEQFLYAIFRNPSFDWHIYKIDLQEGGNPDISLSTTSIDFGPQVFGANYDESFTIGNNGDGTLDISNVEITGPDGTLFGTDLEATTVPPAGDLSPTISFSPTEFGPRNAVLSFETNDVSMPVVEIDLSGVGIYEDQHIALEPGELDFGDVRIDAGGSFSAVRQELAIMNHGQEVLSVTDITTDDEAFSILGTSFPITLGTLDTAMVEVEFRPTEVQAYAAEATIASDDPGNPSATIPLTGTGINPDLEGGNVVWAIQVPDNPATTSTSDKISSIVIPGDLTGDGLPDLVFASRNYLVWAVDVNGWGETSVLWTFNSCLGNNNCGAVAGGGLQLYHTGIDTGVDIDDDGVNDIVIGTEGGNDHVYALSGADGSIIWEVGSDTDPFLASYNSVDVEYDVTGDGIAEVATGTGSASASSPNPFNHRRVYLLDGATGDQLWERSTALPNFRTSMFMNGGEAFVASGGGESPNHFVEAWNAESGNPAWDISPSAAPFLVEPFVINDNGDEDLLSGHSGGLVHRIDGSNGDIVWSTNAGGSVWDVEPVDRGGDVPDVIVGSLAPNVLVLNGETGIPEWQFDLEDQVFDIAAFPDANDDGIDDVAAVGKGGTAVLLSGTDGSLIWDFPFGDGSFDESGEIVVAVPDIDGNGISEFAFGTRDGRAFLLFGGGNPVDNEGEDIPEGRFALQSPYPNPFSQSTTIPFEIGRPAHVRMEIYDVLGRQVATLVDDAYTIGRHEIALDASRLAGGSYILRAMVEPDGGESRTVTQRVTVVR